MANSIKVVIVGTGYVGLTTGICLAYLGAEVRCVDTSAAVVRSLQNGVATIHEPGLQQLMSETPRIHYTKELSEALTGADIVMIAVGTPARTNGATNVSYVEAVAAQIGGNITNQQELLIVNKSTVPIGSAHRVKTIVEQELLRSEKACRVSVISNPEFLREGAAIHNTLYPDRIVVGSDDPAAVNLLRELYVPIINQSFTPPACAPRPADYSVPVFVATNPASAELIKYAANAFLATKISFINEFAGLAEKIGADIKEVAVGIGLDNRIGRNYLEAGIGWGGSCFGKDLRAIINEADQYYHSMELLQATVKVNYRQRMAVIDKLQETLKVVRGNIIGILGLAFKPDTDDLRDAPSIDIIRRLLDLGAKVKVYDPVAMAIFRRNYPDLELEYSPDAVSLSHGCDAVLLLTEWAEFAGLPWEEISQTMRRKVLIDGRNMLEPAKFKSLGYDYRGIGR